MLWNYLIVGGLTTVVSIAVKWGLYFTILDVDNAFQAQVGVIVSWIAAVLFAYITNRIYVFKSKSKKILQEMASFFGARLLTLGMEALLTFIFFTLLGLTSNTWVIIVTFIIQVLVMVFNFIFSKVFVFRKEK
jgi:putative flippase GtrA